MKNHTAKSTAKSHDSVALPHIAGVPPPLYALIGAALVIALVLFAVLVVPSIVRNGSRVEIVSSPPRAVVTVDGFYAGHTPHTLFVQRGVRTIEVVRAGFRPFKEHVEVPGRLVGRLIFPRRITRAIQLDPLVSAEDIATAALREFAAWSLAGQGSEGFPRPPILFDAVNDVLAQGAYQEAEALLVQSMLDVGDRSAAVDWLRAAELVAHTVEGGAPAARLQLEYDAEWLADATPPIEILHNLQRIAAEFLGSSRRVRQRTEAHRAPPTLSAEYLTLEGIEFVAVPAGDFVMGASLADTRSQALFQPHTTTIGSPFYISRTEITRSQFARFVAEESQWSPTNRHRLIAQGLADERYLLNWNTAPLDTHPVTYVSWYAAHAYSEWLGAHGAARGLSARLPREDEWEYAAWLAEADLYDGAFRISGLDGPQVVASPDAHQTSTGAHPYSVPLLYDMLGNVWEWNHNWYHPAQYIWGWDYPQPLGETGAHKAVRGGSWANGRFTVKSATRGHQPPTTASPYLGFRVILLTQSPQ